MKVIKSDAGLSRYKIIFGHLEVKHSKLIAWQVDPDTRERKVFETQLTSFKPDENYLKLKKDPQQSVEKNLPLYVYSEEGQIIFKSLFVEIQDQEALLTLPGELKLLEDQDVKSIQNMIGVHLNVDENFPLPSPKEEGVSVKSLSERSSRDQEFLNNQFLTLSLDEEDKAFSGVRESPRARPKLDKWLTIQTPTMQGFQEVRIYDLSRGGISFITMELDLFPKGTKIKVLSIDNFELDDPLMAEVMSSRAIDELEIEYKIGCQFQEGQTS
jgi:hypothetical protein